MSIHVNIVTHAGALCDDNVKSLPDSSCSGRLWAGGLPNGSGFFGLVGSCLG